MIDRITPIPSSFSPFLKTAAPTTSDSAKTPPEARQLVAQDRDLLQDIVN